MIQIKTLPKTRWKEYRDLRLEALKKYPSTFGSLYEDEAKFTEKEWSYRINSDHSEMIFAIDNDKLIGTVAYYTEVRKSQRHIANVVGMYVKKEYQGKGIGKKLLKEIIKIIKKRRDIKKIKITVVTDNKPALKLYEKVGFKKTALLKKELKVENKYYDEYLMEKLL